ncbi:hypothetical protein [[Limnothrix rosea] IAM M-220]|uniref:hypothetical protein n=1 Tax=[Limnothrix rosea] IAM M-220 TaxID=454133 RepID=UPI00095FFE18|nr:hypothetical protein [[Limnothrix rosea] IAM M-220]OKH18213.1 hypothetical protein NIES208_06730 [[Limnothrix rosea] IAM M-220]
MQNYSPQNHCVVLQNLELLIVSFGGVGTSFFMNFFNQHKLINCRHNGDGLKHLVEPPLVLSPNLKAIYIFGDPIEATVSLFRRGYHHAHSRKISPDKEATLELMSPETSLEDYAGYGKDLFGFERHYQNWSYIDRHYPVLFIYSLQLYLGLFGGNF